MKADRTGRALLASGVITFVVMSGLPLHDDQIAGPGDGEPELIGPHAEAAIAGQHPAISNLDGFR